MHNKAMKILKRFGITRFLDFVHRLMFQNTFCRVDLFLSSGKMGGGTYFVGSVRRNLSPVH
jgi:hypothetical protein